MIEVQIDTIPNTNAPIELGTGCWFVLTEGLVQLALP
jgi:hypothetical protein